MSLTIQADSENTDETRIQAIDGNSEPTRMPEPPMQQTQEQSESNRVSEEDNDDQTRIQTAQLQAESNLMTEAPNDDQTQVLPTTQENSESKVEAEPLLAPSKIQNNSQARTNTGTQGDILTANTEQLEIGATLKNKYFLESKLGEGGMGTVFKARNTLWAAHGDRNPYVAIKVLIPEYSGNKQLVASLFADFKRTRMLSSCPNIVNVQDFDEDGVHVFMALEYLVGKTLSDHIKKLPKPMSFSQAWPIMQGIGNALDFAHKNNIVHRDIKPDNIFITEAEKDVDNADITADRIKVLDFGIASKINESEGDKTRFNGEDLGAFTPAYASPEMKDNCDPDVQDDIYAFGCVIYEMLTGKQYYKQKKVMTEPISKASLPELSTRQREGLKKSLATIRDQRVASITELMEILKPNLGINFISVKYLGLSVAALLVIGFGLWKFWPTPEANNQVKTQATANKPVAVMPAPVPPAPSVQAETPVATGGASTSIQPAVPATDVQATANTAQKTETLPEAKPTAAPVTNEPAVTNTRPQAEVLPEAKPIAAPPAVAEQTQPQYSNDSPDGLVHIETSKTAYKNGEPFELTYSVTKPMYLRILDRDAAGVISPLFPNSLERDKRMSANKKYKFPPVKNGAPVDAKTGTTSTVTIVASEQPFPKNIELLASDGSVSKQVQAGQYSWTQIQYKVQ